MTDARVLGYLFYLLWLVHHFFDSSLALTTSNNSSTVSSPVLTYLTHSTSSSGFAQTLNYHLPELKVSPTNVSHEALLRSHLLYLYLPNISHLHFPQRLQSPKQLTSIRTWLNPDANQLGDLQPLAVMGCQPGDAFPGENELSRHRRRLAGFLNSVFIRDDPRVPLSM